MKRYLLLFMAISLILAFAFPALGQFYGRDQRVDGYTRQDGTHVDPYHRTVPDHDRFNNYSTRDNINPYTGQRGTVDPYRQPDPFSSSSPERRSLHTWP